jgi:hypothetical protein
MTNTGEEAEVLSVPPTHTTDDYDEEEGAIEELENDSDVTPINGFNLLNFPSIKARLECNGLFVQTEPETTEWTNDHPASTNTTPSDHDRDACYRAQSPPSSRKFLQIDESKTPRAALSMGGKDGGEVMDFEILPDETDDDDEEEEEEEEDRGFPQTDLEINENESPVTSETRDTNSRNKINNEALSLVTPVSPTSKQHEALLLPDSEKLSSSVPPMRRRFLFAQKSPRSFNNGGGRPNATALSEAVDNDPMVIEREKPKRTQRLTTMIRKIGASRKEKEDEIPLVDSALEEQDSSSDESSFDDDEKWSDEESQIFEDDLDEAIDCSDLSTSLPNSFLDLPPDMYDYLDADLVAGIKHQDITTFAREHHLFVKGLLQFLAERDLIGVEDDVLGTHNISKMGVLRKKDGKIGWRVKYVEIRKGNLTYFADKKEREMGRTIHLRKRTCSCRTLSNNKDDFTTCFELIVDGGRRLLWTAQSEEECQAWVRSINHAMIGEVDDSRDLPLDIALYQTAIDDYRCVQASLKEARSRQEYLVAMNRLLYRQTSSSALRVPMKWIRDTYLEEHSVEEPMKDNERIKYTVREFWKNLCNTSVVLNGHLVEADGVYSGERVIGALSRCILEFDKVEDTNDFDQIFNSLKRSQAENHNITELEAVAYARNILNGALLSTSRGDIGSAVEELFRNENVSYTKLESSEPLHVYVSYAGDDFSESKARSKENVGWIETKSKKSKKWKMRYFVVSEGVLSYFERAEPRPHRLGGQMVLRDAKITILEDNTLSIEAQNQERLLRFDDRGELLRWKAIIIDDKDGKVDGIIDQDFDKLEETLILCSANNNINNEDHLPQLTEVPSKEDEITTSKSISTLLDENIGKSRRGVVRDAGAKILRKAARAKIGMQRAKHATGARMKSIRTGAGMLIRGVRGNSANEGNQNDLLLSSTRSLNAFTEKRETTVQAVVEMNNTFQVLSKYRRKADEPEDEILLTVRVKLYQAFLLSGGPHGRLACGDELLLMEFSAEKGAEDVPSDFFQAPTSL